MATCRQCGEENPERARFCLGCGMPLAAAAPVEEERKVVSILFVDLVGFTAGSDRADPEDVRARLRPYHGRLKQEIERFGGTVEKFVGDAVMAAFGAPVAHEDDAERAVRAGLRILEAIDELNEVDPGLELSVRAAVNTGEAVVALGARPAEGEGFVTGDVVNTAARLQQAAPVGALVVGEQTFQTTKHVIEYEELEPISAKGKAELLSVQRAMRPRSRFGVDVEQRAPTPLIGREYELALLEDTYGRTLRESSVQLVTLTGEPGVGKTRLLEEFRHFVDDRPEIVSWRQGRCLPYGEGVTFWALGEIVKAQAGILESDTPEEAAEKLAASVAALVEEPSERDWFTARLAPLVGAQPAEGGATAERSESFAAWRRFLEALASSRPLILVLEDLHWADRALLEFVEHLIDWVTDVPLLVVSTARPELYERQPGWGGGKRNSTTIALSPLTADETARLLSALLSQAALPAETQAALLERAGGNPLYAEEFVRMLTDRGFLTQAGLLTEIESDGGIPVPETVQALIAARLDTLPPERKAFLHDASVVGKVFWTGAVASIGDRDESAVRDGLHELVRKELVRPARISSVKDQEEFSFWHLLVRDVAYAQIPRAARARKHRAAAAWIERMAEDRVADHAEILVHHYGQALELARAAGAADEAGELEATLGRFLVLAGDRAVELDVGRAESLYGRALELLAAGHPDRPVVLAKAAEAANIAGRYPEAERAGSEAIAGFREQGRTREAAEALLTLSSVAWYRGETARAEELTREAVALLEREPPGRELASAYAKRGSILSLAGHQGEALEWAGKALAVAEQLGLVDLAMQARGWRGAARSDLGDVEGLEDLREALRLGLELGLGRDTGVVYNNLAFGVWPVEGPKKALEIYDEGIVFSERRGLVRQVMWTSAERLWMLYEIGEWDPLLERADMLIEWDLGRGGSQIGVIALTTKAQVFIWRGEFPKAAALASEFVPRAREIGELQVLVPALTTAALLEQERHNLAEAVQLLEEVEKATRGKPYYRAQGLPDALRICAAAGSIDLGERLVEGVAQTAGRPAHAVLTARAILAEAQGKLEEAAELYVQSADGWRDFGFALEEGHALLGAGRCVLRVGRSREAAAGLQEAREKFASLQARPLVAAAEALIEQAAAVAS